MWLEWKSMLLYDCEKPVMFCGCFNSKGSRKVVRVSHPEECHRTSMKYLKFLAIWNQHLAQHRPTTSNCTKTYKYKQKMAYCLQNQVFLSPDVYSMVNQCAECGWPRENRREEDKFWIKDLKSIHVKRKCYYWQRVVYTWFWLKKIRMLLFKVGLFPQWFHCGIKENLYF